MARDEIFTSNVVYESAHGILSKGMNDISARVLGLLRSSLRAAGPGPMRERTASVRELLRCSGCLQDMLDMFLSTTIMHKENWKVLCECLAEACRDCPDNQRYCSSLIPICIQRTGEMDNKIIKLLYCLLLNNTSNINLFVECNGTSIFTKDTIHDCSRMELLSIVVENASAANLLKRDSDLLKTLITIGEDYKVNCQGSWKIVEWASVILFHLASYIEGSYEIIGIYLSSCVDRSIEATIKSSDFDIEINISETNLNLSVSFLLKPNWEKVKSINLLKNAATQNKIDEHMSFRSSTIDFAPTFASTPKRKITTTPGVQVAELSEQLISRTEQKSNNISQKEPRRNISASLIKKTLSTSTRLLSIVNNSCISIYQTMGAIFCRKPANTKSRSLSQQTFKIEKETMNKFTKYLKQSVSHTNTKASDNLNDHKQAKRKLAIRRKFRKNIVNKLKTGMHFYGCNFKKIAQAMWSHEKEMTPKVLYNIYRKYILK